MGQQRNLPAYHELPAPVSTRRPNSIEIHLSQLASLGFVQIQILFTHCFAGAKPAHVIVSAKLCIPGRLKFPQSSGYSVAASDIGASADRAGSCPGRSSSQNASRCVQKSAGT